MVGVFVVRKGFRTTQREEKNSGATGQGKPRLLWGAQPELRAGTALPRHSRFHTSSWLRASTPGVPTAVPGAAAPKGAETGQSHFQAEICPSSCRKSLGNH